MREVAEDILNAHLDRASTSTPEVVKAIRAYNQRFSALKSIDDTLRLRADKEALSSMSVGHRLHKGLSPYGVAGMVALTAAEPKVAAATAASYLAAKSLPATARAVNDVLLVPLQLAAQKGATWATISQQAMQSGVPQSLARAIYARYASGGNVVPIQPTATDRKTSTSTGEK
jgi:hypothetical protein